MILEGTEASGTVIDGQHIPDGLEIRSRLAGNKWQVPKDITVKNSTITGRILIWGMAYLGEGTEINGINRHKLSSFGPGHTERSRAAAPTDILLEDITITGTGLIPLYIAPGVTKVTLIHSTIDGWARLAGIYLDAESAHNTIQDNEIFIEHRPPWYNKVTALLGYPPGSPAIAVDGSSHNLIEDNKIFARRGGIYIYRNCGEGSVVRHATPSHNIIRRNEFLDTTRWSRWRHPIIWENSRKGKGWVPFLRYPCGLDDGYPFGSSQSDMDHASDNVIEDNTIS